jgi:hypothetical protein
MNILDNMKVQNLDLFFHYLDKPDLRRTQNGSVQSFGLCKRICLFVSKIFVRIARIWNRFFGDHQVYNEIKARKVVLDYLDKSPAEQETKKTRQILAIYDRLTVLKEGSGTYADESKIDKLKINALRNSLIESTSTTSSNKDAKPIKPSEEIEAINEDEENNESRFDSLMNPDTPYPFTVDETHYLNKPLPYLFEGLTDAQIKAISEIDYVQEMESIYSVVSKSKEPPSDYFVKQFVGCIDKRRGYDAAPQTPFGIPEEFLQITGDLNLQLHKRLRKVAENKAISNIKYVSYNSDERAYQRNLFIDENRSKINEDNDSQIKKFGVWVASKKDAEPIPEALKMEYDEYQRWEQSITDDRVKKLPIFLAHQQLETLQSDLRQAKDSWYEVIGPEHSYKETIKQFLTHLNQKSPKQSASIPIRKLLEHSKQLTNKIQSYLPCDAALVIKDFIQREEVFFSKMEKHLRILLFACRESPFAKPVVYNVERARDLMEAMDQSFQLCATGKLDTLERLSDAYLKEMKNSNSQKKKSANAYEYLVKEMYLILGSLRKQILGQWAMHWKDETIKSKSYTSAEVSESLEIHFEKFAMQKVGVEWGIPQSEENYETGVFSPEIDADLRAFFKDKYSNARNLVLYFTSSLERRRNLKEEMMAWAQDHLMRDWGSKRYDRYKDNIMKNLQEALNGLRVQYEAISKSEESSKKQALENQIFQPLWSIVEGIIKKHGIGLKKTSFSSTITLGMPFAQLLEKLEDLIKNALLKDRKLAFNYKVIDEEKGKIHPWVIREFLLHNQVIKPLPA